MNFFKEIRGEGEFKTQAKASLKRATHAFDTEFSSLLEPYYNLTSHGNSLLHPFYHMTQLVRDVTRFAYGACVFAGSLLMGNITNGVGVLKGMCQLALAALVEVINVLVSVLSFATRTLSTIVNLGYISFRVKEKYDSQGGAYMKSLNEYLENPHVQNLMKETGHSQYLPCTSSDQIADHRNTSEYCNDEDSIQDAAFRLI